MTLTSVGLDSPDIVTSCDRRSEASDDSSSKAGLIIIDKSMFRIRISFHADPDPGSQKRPYGSGSKEVNTKEE